MVLLKPSFIIQSPAVPSSYVQAARLDRRPSSYNPHISSFCSLLLDIQIYSPSIKVVKHPELEISQSCPVFGHQDKIEGKVLLDPSCSQSGRLTVSLEGTFEFSSVEGNPDDDYPHKLTVRTHRHVFLSSSVVTPFSSISDSRSTIREALSIRKRPSTSSLNSPTYRSCEFSFELPRGSQPGEEIPSTFAYKTPTANLRGKSCMEVLEVAYRITAIWESTDGSETRAILETHVLLQPDTEFQSIDGFAMEPKSWLEMPLIPERPIPFSCAVTLPRSQSFSHCGSIQYFVVFSTNTRSPSLIKEIAADATIAVSLIRKITLTSQRTPQSQILPDTPPASNESDSHASPFASRSKPFRRSVRTSTRSHVREDLFTASKPLPEPPQEVFCTSRTLQTQVSIGFPKRPRANDEPRSLPDGLYKGKLQLSKDVLPSVEWPGISVKYYLDVSVLVGQDDVRACIPIRIY